MKLLFLIPALLLPLAAQDTPKLTPEDIAAVNAILHDRAVEQTRAELVRIQELLGARLDAQRARLELMVKYTLPGKYNQHGKEYDLSTGQWVKRQEPPKPEAAKAAPAKGEENK